MRQLLQMTNKGTMHIQKHLASCLFKLRCCLCWTDTGQPPILNILVMYYYEYKVLHWQFSCNLLSVVCGILLVLLHTYIMFIMLNLNSFQSLSNLTCHIFWVPSSLILTFKMGTNTEYIYIGKGHMCCLTYQSLYYCSMSFIFIFNLGADMCIDKTTLCY